MRRHIFATTILAVGIGGAATAGPVADFETTFRGVYGNYRTALFATNSGDAAKSAKAVAAFEDGWAALIADHGDNPPPQYADDPAWGDTLASVQARLANAQADVAAGTLPAAHEALEGIRDDIGALHDRNGIETFSDRMNAYHAAMEEILAIDPASVDAALVPHLLQEAGVLAYLAADIAAHPAPEAAHDAYAPLASAFQASVAGFVTAVESADPDTIRAGMAGLKVPYSKFFLMFG